MCRTENDLFFPPLQLQRSRCLVLELGVSTQTSGQKRGLDRWNLPSLREGNGLVSPPQQLTPRPDLAGKEPDLSCRSRSLLFDLNKVLEGSWIPLEIEFGDLDLKAIVSAFVVAAQLEVFSDDVDVPEG